MTVSNRHSREGGNPESLITEHLDTWSSVIKTKSAAGRGRGKGSGKKFELYGIKKLRELILELAVRGLLVSQDPNDEPVSELLKKIASEKNKLVKEGKIKKLKWLQEISDEEKIDNLPPGWEFVRLNDLGEWGAGATPRRGDSGLYGGNIPWFKSGELNSDYISESDETVTKLALNNTSLRFNKVGDVLLAMYGATIGKTSILSVPATTNQAVCACTPFSGFSNVYLLTLLKAYRPRFIGMGAGGAQPNISREKIINTVIALPPTEEQHRIVAKVDELMALCDQLEQQTEASISAHQTLVKTLLGALTNASERDGLTAKDGGNAENSGAIFGANQAWARIAEHFDTLFTTEWSIDQLKKTILQLAVMGKLAPQNFNDESASQLLKKISAEKSKLLKEGKIKKHPVVEPIGENVVLPSNWSSIVIQDFADIRLGSTPSRIEPKYWNGNIPWVSSGEVAGGIIYNTSEMITKEGFKNSSTSIIPKRSVLMAIIGQGKTRGQTALLEIDACTNQNVAAFVFNEKYVMPEFILIWAKSKYEAHRGDGRGGAQPALNGKIVRSFRFPLPPFAEQARIVKKTDELISLCDTLKARIKTTQTTQLQLADTMTEKALV